MKVNAAILVYVALSLLPAGIVWSTSRQVNPQQFRVEMQGRTIGMLSTSQIIENNRITYLLHTGVKIDVVINVAVTENISDVFEYDTLVKSVQKRTVNDKVKSNNTLQKTRTGYQLVNASQESSQLNEHITQSVLSLYYEEPADGDRVYSEHFQQVLTIQKSGVGKYCLELPNGSSSTYTYMKQKLQQVESQTSWGRITFIRN